MRTKFTSIVSTAGVLLFAGVLLAVEPKLAKPAHDHGDAADHGHFHNAVAVLVPKSGSKVQGTLKLTATTAGVQITGEITGLTPGKHGFHVHEFGDLSDEKGLAAGPHYNPDGHEHGGPESAAHHAGDLGNVEANDQGVAKVKITAHGLSLHHILGRSLVVHAGEDDLKSQPSGDSGDRVAIGVIALAAAPKPAEPAK
ncbi:superoxide dismutase family protein [Planctomicrobium sp. SH661]|uniref:superoxide dismutase family protein n=1 Tax=Planctomicrobium sp. SH661 TaxID=3448124 RepID=UPI003F5B73E4